MTPKMATGLADPWTLEEIVAPRSKLTHYREPCGLDTLGGSGYPNTRRPGRDGRAEILA